MRATLAGHKGTQGKSKPTEREAEAIETKHEGDPSNVKGTQGKSKQTEREAAAIEIEPEGDPSSS